MITPSYAVASVQWIAWNPVTQMGNGGPSPGHKLWMCSVCTGKRGEAPADHTRSKYGKYYEIGQLLQQLLFPSQLYFFSSSSSSTVSAIRMSLRIQPSPQQHNQLHITKLSRHDECNR
jgi:hypothetical protein